MPAPDDFRTVMSHHPAGVSVITAVAPDGERLAMVVSSFASVSLDPPLVSFMPQKTSKTMQQFVRCDSLCANVLADDQAGMVNQIFRRDSDRLADIDTHLSPAGNPVLDGALAWLDLKPYDMLEAGDHWIALYEVTDLGITGERNPLVFFQGGYGSFAVPSLVARSVNDHDLVDAVRYGELARPVLEEAAAAIGGECGLLVPLNDDELVTVASAGATPYGSNVALGLRIPVIPPLGDLIPAHGDDEDVEHWVRKGGSDDQTREFLRSRVAFARDQGYSIAFRSGGGGDPYAAMAAATRLYSAGLLTPNKEKELRLDILASLPCFPLEVVRADGDYDVASIVVPVTDGSNNLRALLRASQLPRRQSGGAVFSWVRLLQGAASTLATL